MEQNKKITLLVASTNEKKLKELKDLLSDLPVNLVSLAGFSFNEVEENGKTFEDNASLKALGYARQTGLLTLAEDSGLCCEALEGAPGVYSARFAGLSKNDHENNKKVLRLLEKVPDNCRGAYFKSVVAIAEPDKIIGFADGEVHGVIGQETRGTNGFGYDSIFIFPSYQKTFGEVSSEMKYKVSHRAKALVKAKEILKKYITHVKV